MRAARQYWCAALCAGFLAPIAASSQSVPTPAPDPAAPTLPAERPSPEPGLSRIVSVALREVTIPNALNEISRASGVHFIYRNESIPDGYTVSVDATPRRLDSLLVTILRGSGLTARPAGKDQIFILPRMAAPRDTARTVTASVGLLPAVTILGPAAGVRSALERSQRELPNAVQIITGDMIARRDARTVADLFHGDIPGVIAFDQGSDVNAIGTPAVQVRGTAGFMSLNTPLKTYVDGVEMTDPTFVNHIDAKTIERIEIALGPQASTIYGSGALSGVMQIFTKRGTDIAQWTPLIRATISGGWLSGRGRNTALSPLFDHSLSADGGTGWLTYHADAGYAFDGKHAGDQSTTASSRNTFGTVGVRSLYRTIDADASARVNDRRFDASVDDFYAQDVLSGRLSYNPYRLVPYNRPGNVNQRAAALGVRWSPLSWLQQQLTVGLDQQLTDIHAPATRVTVADSLTAFDHGTGSRRTLTYYLTATHLLSEAHDVRATLTAGTNASTYQYRSLYQGVLRNSDIFFDTTTSPDGGFLVRFRTQTHRAGYFSQAQLGVADAFFLTAGVRTDEDAVTSGGPHVLPRLGAAYVRETGQLTVKVRGSYGIATREPCITCRAGGATPSSLVLANPVLQREAEHGGDIGADVYFGNRASLQLTGYAQHVNAFIIENRLSKANETPVISQYQNGGRVRNVGMESNGAMRFGRVTVNAALAVTDARITHTSAALPGGLTVNDRPLLVAHTSGALSGTYSHAKWQLTTGASYVGPYNTLGDGTVDRFTTTVPGDTAVTTVVRAPSDLRFYANGSFDVNARWRLFMRGDNLNNAYGAAVSRNVAGRRMTIGVRIGR